LLDESEKFTDVVGRGEGRIALCSLKRCVEDPPRLVPEEYPCPKQAARCKAENVTKLRNVIEVFEQHYWLLQLGSAKEKTLLTSWRSGVWIGGFNGFAALNLVSVASPSLP